MSQSPDIDIVTERPLEALQMEQFIEGVDRWAPSFPQRAGVESLASNDGIAWKALHISSQMLALIKRTELPKVGGKRYVERSLELYRDGFLPVETGFAVMSEISDDGSAVRHPFAWDVAAKTPTFTPYVDAIDKFPQFHLATLVKLDKLQRGNPLNARKAEIERLQGVREAYKGFAIERVETGQAPGELAYHGFSASKAHTALQLLHNFIDDDTESYELHESHAEVSDASLNRLQDYVARIFSGEKYQPKASKRLGTPGLGLVIDLSIARKSEFQVHFDEIIVAITPPEHRSNIAVPENQANPKAVFEITTATGSSGRKAIMTQPSQLPPVDSFYYSNAPRNLWLAAKTRQAGDNVTTMTEFHLRKVLEDIQTVSDVELLP